MIDYAKYNDWAERVRKERLMVIYKEGTKTQEEVRGLNGYHFLSDEQNLPMTICGLRAGGIIVEEGADFKYPNFRYALSRLVTPDEFIIFIMDHLHKERLGDILEEMRESATDCTRLNKFIDKIRLCKVEDDK